MSVQVGWTLSDQVRKLDGFKLQTHAGHASVHTSGIPKTARERLDLLRRAYQAIDPFVPVGAACLGEDLERLLDLMNDLRGYGQLSLDLQYKPEAPRSVTSDGRAYLQARRVARHDALAASGAAQKELHALADDRLIVDRRISATARGARAHLLVRRADADRLLAGLADCAQRAKVASGKGALVITGPWPPSAGLWGAWRADV